MGGSGQAGGKAPQDSVSSPPPPPTHWGQARALVHREVAIFVLLVRGGRVQLLGGLFMPGGGGMAGSAHTFQVQGPRLEARAQPPLPARGDGAAGPGDGGGGGAGAEVGAARRGISPLQAPHLLPLVLVVVHLRAVREPLVPGLRRREGGSSRRRGPEPGAGQGGSTHRDLGRCGGARRLRGSVVGLLGQADVPPQPAGAEQRLRPAGSPPARPPPPGRPAHLHQQRAATARAAAPATEHATMSTAGGRGGR